MTTATLGRAPRGSVSYSDVNNLIDITHYDMNVDLRQHKKVMTLRAWVAALTQVAALRAVSFQIGETLSALDNQRLKKQLRLKSVRVRAKTPPPCRKIGKEASRSFSLTP